MSTRTSIVMLAGVVIVGGSVGACASPSGGGAPRSRAAALPAVGRLIPAAQRPVTPAIAGTALTGAHLNVRGMHGNVVVVNFWASWCGPCKAELPTLRTLAQRYSSRGIRFVGVDTRDNRTSAMAMERRYRLTYPSIFDPDYAVTAAMGALAPRATPTTDLIDKQGRLAATFFGLIASKKVEPMLVTLAAEPPK